MRSELRAAQERLAAAGVASPRHDAETLAAHVLGVRRGGLAAADPMTSEQAARFAELVARRADRVPLQHLVGTAGFRRIDLAVGPGVFVPRPETEVVVEWCLAALRSSGGERPVVVDLCSGSGAVALAVADEHPTAVVHAVEREPDAYAWLARNAEGADRVRTHLADAADALPELSGAVDLVVSNPPYVAAHERDQVDPEVRDHDPAAALWAGGDGLDVLRVVEAAARRLLRPDGLFAAEHSDRQGESAPELLRAAGWADVADHRDLTDRPRFVTGRWPGCP